MDEPGPRARVRLVAVDVDGTLLTSRHEVTDAVVAAVRRARDRGVAVVPTTSRPPRALWPILQRLGLVEPEVFVGSQGALVGFFSPTGALRAIHRHPMPAEAAMRTVRAALEAGLAANWFTQEDWLVTHVDAQVRREAEIVGFSPTVADLAAQPEGPDKLLIIAPPGREEVLGGLAASLQSDLHAQTSNPTYLEITRADVDKASALRALCAERGIAPEEVVAIGDGMNDLAMMGFAGTAIAPANARAEVLAVADLVTTSNDDDGVARALDELAQPA